MSEANVTIKQMQTTSGSLIAPYTPDHAVYDENGVRLDIRLAELRALSSQTVDVIAQFGNVSGITSQLSATTEEIKQKVSDNEYVTSLALNDLNKNKANTSVVSSIETEVASLSGEVAAISSIDFSGTTEALSGAIVSLSGSVIESEGVIAKALNEHEEKFTTLENKITTLSGDVVDNEEVIAEALNEHEDAISSLTVNKQDKFECITEEITSGGSKNVSIVSSNGTTHIGADNGIIELNAGVILVNNETIVTKSNIPTNVSQLANDANYTTMSAVTAMTESEYVHKRLQVSDYNKTTTTTYNENGLNISEKYTYTSEEYSSYYELSSFGITSNVSGLSKNISATVYNGKDTQLVVTSTDKDANFNEVIIYDSSIAISKYSGSTEIYKDTINHEKISLWDSYSATISALTETINSLSGQLETLKSEILKNEKTISTSLNDLNDRVTELES